MLSGKNITGFIWSASRNIFFHIHNRYDAFAGQPCFLGGSTDLRFIVIQQFAWESGECGCHLLCEELRPVSCLNWQTLAPVHSSFCENLMYHSLRKQARSVHLCSWLTAKAKCVRAVRYKLYTVQCHRSLTFNLVVLLKVKLWPVSKAKFSWHRNFLLC